MNVVKVLFGLVALALFAVLSAFILAAAVVGGTFILGRYIYLEIQSARTSPLPPPPPPGVSAPLRQTETIHIPR